MRRGLSSWLAEVKALGGPRAGVVLGLLTFRRDASHEEASAALMRFWELHRHKFGRLQRFGWWELTRKGRLHYHFMIVDAPTVRAGHSKAALERQWGEGIVKLRWRGAEWFDRGAGRYAGAYAKKMGDKSYQQAYSSLSRAIRTYHSNRCVTPESRVERAPGWARTVAGQYGRAVTDARPGGAWAGGWRLRDLRGDWHHLWLQTRWHRGTDHGPPGGHLEVLGPVWEGEAPWDARTYDVADELDTHPLDFVVLPWDLEALIAEVG